MISNILFIKNKKTNTKKTYCLCESNFLYNIISDSSRLKNKLIFDHFVLTKENGTIYLYVEKETFNKLSICHEIIRSMTITELINFLDNKNHEYIFTETIDIIGSKKDGVYQAFIKLYTLPPDQLETRINQYRLERL